MQYAIVKGEKILPQAGLKGICPGCGREVIAKCGTIKLHHWAHKAIKDCDPWWEPETQWHRDWKNQFPEKYREIVFNDNNTGEIHRADIHTSQNVTIEFQNSPISIQERESRDKFYEKLIWVVNATKFKGFQFGANIPDPNSKELNKYEFFISRFASFFLKEELESGLSMVQVFSLNSPELEHIKPGIAFWLFEWKRPHQAWLSSDSPIFFDVGESFLYLLKKKQQTRSTLLYIQVIKKKDFIAKYSK